MYKKLHKLEILINEFDKRFASKKRERNIVDFTDVEHFALHILINQDDKGNVSTTDIAKKYSQKFEEIAKDEYQDSNEVQEYILTAVSRENNIFMVGDVKQSIYKSFAHCLESAISVFSLFLLKRAFTISLIFFASSFISDSTFFFDQSTSLIYPDVS